VGGVSLQRFSVEGMARKNFHPWIRPRTGLESGSRRTIGSRSKDRPVGISTQWQQTPEVRRSVGACGIGSITRGQAGMAIAVSNRSAAAPLDRGRSPAAQWVCALSKPACVSAA